MSLSVLVFLGCKGSQVELWEFSPEQRQTADQIVSVFENNSTSLRYEFAKNIGDGRGITAGRGGFTSATKDLYTAVNRYSAVAPQTPLTRYLPRLKELADAQSGSTVGLEGLESAWHQAAQDKSFRDIQDEIVNEWYYQPAVRTFNRLGLTQPIGLLLLYDAGIQHGFGNGPDGVPAMVKKTNEKMRGTPSAGVDETDWLLQFQQVRRDVLTDASTPETRRAWAESAPRVDTLTSLMLNQNIELKPVIVIDTWGTRHEIPQ